MVDKHKELLKQLSDKIERKVFSKADIERLSEIVSKICKEEKK